MTAESVPTEPPTTLAGRIVWNELATSDPAAAAAFYSSLLGWSVSETDMGMEQPYRMFGSAAVEQPVGGAIASPPDTPPHWCVYLSVDDVGAALEQVAALGGEAITEEMAVPNMGSFAIVADPAGAVFGLFRGDDPADPSEVTTPADRTFCWAQLMVKDVDAAIEFYGPLMGWTVERMPGGIAAFSDAHATRASAMPFPPGLDAPAHWLAYVAAHDIDAVTARAAQLGATVMREPTDMPGMGRFSVVIDPTGATFALWRDASLDG